MWKLGLPNPTNTSFDNLLATILQTYDFVFLSNINFFSAIFHDFNLQSSEPPPLNNIPYYLYDQSKALTQPSCVPFIIGI